MKLVLFHGRIDPKEDMHDWGFSGPHIEDVNYVHWTYNSRLVVGFKTQQSAERARTITG